MAGILAKAWAGPQAAPVRHGHGLSHALTLGMLISSGNVLIDQGPEPSQPGRQGSAPVRQLYLDFQYFEVVLAFQIDLDVAGIDIHVFGEHGDQVAL